MNSSNSNDALNQENAQLLLLQFWVAFNNVSLYGAKHPLARQSLFGFTNQLMKMLPHQKMVTFYIEQGTLLCEEWRVEKQNFAARLVQRLIDSGVQSIALTPEFREEFIPLFISILTDTNSYPTVDDMSMALSKHNIKGARFNYVIYQKVTMDENVVHKDLKYLASIFNVDTTKESKSPSVDSGPVSFGTESSSSLLYRIRALRENLQMSIDTLPTVDEIAEGIGMLRKSVMEELQANVAMGKITEVDGAVVDELEQLTADTFVRIVREEYRAEKLSPKRLAEIIKRLIPDPHNLKRLLPSLKKMLLEEGMTPQEYLELVHALALEFQEDRIIDTLSEAVKDIGISIEELLNAVQKNPKSAARLILLASEIGSMMGTDKYRLSSLIDYYLKHVSSLFLSKYAGVSNESTEDNDKLDDTLSFIENDLVSYLSSKGIDPAILKNLRAIQQNIAMSETTSFIKKSGIDSEQPTSDTKESTPQSPIGTPNFTKPVKQPGNKPGGSYFPKTPYSQTPGEQAGFPEGHGFPRQAGKKEGTPGHPFFGLRKNHSENKSETGRSGPSDSAMEAETDKYKNGGDHHAKTPSSVPGESSAPTAGGTRLPAKASGTQSPGMQPSVPRSGRSTKQKKKTYPKGILRPSDTRTQVQREISRAIRYGTPFSCISLSIMDIDDGSGFRPILESDTFDLVTALYETIRKQIRDIDLIGSLGSKGPEHLLFVLAETEVDGANVVLERIRKVIEDSEFNSGDNSCKMLVTLSSIQYNVKRKPKWATFLRNFRDVQKNAMRENDD